MGYEKKSMNNHSAHCPHCGLKFQSAYEDILSKIDYCNIFENWIEWSTFIYCPICKTPITLGGGGNNFWSLFTLRYFFSKTF